MKKEVFFILDENMPLTDTGEKSFTILEFFATTFTLLSILLLSYFEIDLTIYWTLAGIGNVLWILWAICKDSNGILLVNMVMIFAAINGIFG